MTDKQIIIDGVDVSGCSNLYDIEDCICIDNGIEEHCKDKNCYYKQLKRKEQECEELRGDLYFTNEQLKDFKSHYDKVVEECENLREKYLGLKEQKGSYIVQLNTVNEQLDQLKAENEQLKKQACGLRPELKHIIDKTCCKYNINAKYYHEKIVEIINNLDKYKQTLTEIKEICNNNDELKGNFNLIDCDKYKYGKHNLANKILQKISECEGNDE